MKKRNKKKIQKKKKKKKTQKKTQKKRSRLSETLQGLSAGLAHSGNFENYLNYHLEEYMLKYTKRADYMVKNLIGVDEFFFFG